MLALNADKYSNKERGDDIVSYLDNYKFEIEGERALWQSVIMQAVLDLQVKADNLKKKIKRAETLKWFSKQDEDFMFVCQMADLDADMIIKGARKLFKAHHKSFKRKNTSKSKIEQKNSKIATVDIELTNSF